jgi:iron complex outermembrane receptor protein
MVSQDLTLTSTNNGPLSWLAGASYYKEHGFFFSSTFGGLLVPSDAPRLLRVAMFPMSISRLSRCSPS